ncbi:murein DD-endopeptidase MepM [Utexia brackfieldae]|uniref:murein DD-endopeptidase MepM n=1 Tax=Utexia brackfieldae TaxID=3074108 RepID=UPI00370DC2FC
MRHFDSSERSLGKFKFPYYSILGVIFLVVLFAVLWRPVVSDHITNIPLNNKQNNNSVTILEDKQLPAAVGSASVEIIKDRSPADTESLDQPVPEDTIVKDEIDEAFEDKDDGLVYYTVDKGDTLSGILSQYGVNRNDIYMLTKQYKQLANLRIGQQVSWEVDENKHLQVFNWYVSSRDTKVYELDSDGNGYSERVEQRESEWKPIIISGKIDGSFVADARKAGLTLNEIATITKALQWQLDFRRLQKDEQFVVYLMREMVGNRHEGSKLLGVRIKNGSRNYYAILADDGRYYDINGLGLARSFLRYPLQKPARISSPFNPHRLNPVTKRVTPHNGVDFAVSRGTPVLASGDGEVMVAKYSGSAGNYIAIRHGRQYMTRYMHLDKILVKPGQKVSKGDVIALSGNTGRSTGPHLHYELHVDNKPVNPMTSSLPQSDELTGKSKTAFLELAKSMREKLVFSDQSTTPADMVNTPASTASSSN